MAASGGPQRKTGAQKRLGPAGEDGFETGPGRARSPRVLVVGYRRGLNAALRDLGIPYVQWRAEDGEQTPPWIGSEADVRRAAAHLAKEGPFTHVIAGTEAAVVPASLARRVLGARKSEHSTVRRCHDKLFMKTRLKAAGIPMTDFLDGNEAPTAEEILARFGAPVVVKPRRSSGGKDLRFIENVSTLRGVSLRDRLVERFVDAPEMSIESFVRGGEVVFENFTEYYRKRYINIVPAPIDADMLAQVREINRRTIKALRIDWGMTHVEVYCTAEGAKFGEIALRPPGGHIMHLMGMAWNFDAWRAFVEIELDLPVAFPGAPEAVAAAVIVHPGPGVVASVHGLEEVRVDPRVREARLTVEAGDLIPPRDNVGREIGHVLLCARDRAHVLEGIAEVERVLRVELRV